MTPEHDHHRIDQIRGRVENKVVITLQQPVTFK